MLRCSQPRVLILERPYPDAQPIVLRDQPRHEQRRPELILAQTVPDRGNLDYHNVNDALKSHYATGRQLEPV